MAATPGTTYRFKGWSLFYAGYSGGVETLDPGSPYGEVPSLTETLFVMEFLNGSGTQIGSADARPPHGADERHDVA